MSATTIITVLSWVGGIIATFVLISSFGLSMPRRKAADDEEEEAAEGTYHLKVADGYIDRGWWRTATEGNFKPGQRLKVKCDNPETFQMWQMRNLDTGTVHGYRGEPAPVMTIEMPDYNAELVAFHEADTAGGTHAGGAAPAPKRAAAETKHMVTVTGGTVRKRGMFGALGGGSASGEFKPGDELTSESNNPDTFHMWRVERPGRPGVDLPILGNAMASKTTFTMPDHPVNITAEFGAPGAGGGGAAAPARRRDAAASGGGAAGGPGPGVPPAAEGGSALGAVPRPAGDADDVGRD